MEDTMMFYSSYSFYKTYYLSPLLSSFFNSSVLLLWKQWKFHLSIYIVIIWGVFGYRNPTYLQFSGVWSVYVKTPLFKTTSCLLQNPVPYFTHVQNFPYLVERLTISPLLLHSPFMTVIPTCLPGRFDFCKISSSLVALGPGICFSLITLARVRFSNSSAKTFRVDLIGVKI